MTGTQDEGVERLALRSVGGLEICQEMVAGEIGLEARALIRAELQGKDDPRHLKRCMTPTALEDFRETPSGIQVIQMAVTVKRMMRGVGIAEVTLYLSLERSGVSAPTANVSH